MKEIGTSFSFSYAFDFGSPAPLPIRKGEGRPLRRKGRGWGGGVECSESTRKRKICDKNHFFQIILNKVLIT